MGFILVGILVLIYPYIDHIGLEVLRAFLAHVIVKKTILVSSLRVIFWAYVYIKGM